MSQSLRPAADTFDITPSCLGFGCASLGSRVSARAGLRALAEAYDAGITWYDVAPAYGAGDAETILASFLKGRRERLVLATKVGLAPPARLPAIKLAYALGRPVVGAFGGLRRAFRKAPVTRNQSVPLDGPFIDRSIATSLARLGSDRVDVLALHEPSPEDVVRDDVLRALERVVQRGQASIVAVAGETEACRAAAQLGLPFRLLQTSTSSFRHLTAMGVDLTDGPRMTVVHSVLGVGGDRDRLITALTADPAKLKRLADDYGYAPAAQRAASELLLDAAFAMNPRGIVLLSMFGKDHLAAALARARHPNPEAPRLARYLLG